MWESMGVEYQYLDILFVDNLVMNFFILWIVHRFSKNRGSVWRLWLAAAAGALYAVLIVLPGFQMLQKIPMKLALSLIMILTAFELNTFKEFFKTYAVFYMITFIFGGVALSLYFINHEFIDIGNGAFIIKDYPVKYLIMTCILVGVLIRSVLEFIRLRLSKNELYIKWKYLSMKTRSLPMLCLIPEIHFDPISQYPVLVIEFQRIKDILPHEIKTVFEESKENDLEMIMQAMRESPWLARFRMIPFTALGKSNGMLIGFKPDGVNVLINGNWRRICNIIVAIYNNRLSKDKQYQALIHPEMVA